jgi:hypothetical protein
VSYYYSLLQGTLNSDFSLQKPAVPIDKFYGTDFFKLRQAKQI